MYKDVKLFKKHERGQVLVIVALMLVGFIGFGALLTDGAMMQLSRRELQAAADAAALAGASYLPGDTSTAISTARGYVTANGFLESDIKAINTSYGGDDKKIEVILEKPVTFTFGRIFNPSGSTISARAVAKADNIWDGDALPFINQEDDDDYMDGGELWVKIDPGNFESMLMAEEYGYTVQGDSCQTWNFIVDYENGLEVDMGVVANKKQEVECVVETNGSGYLFSLSEQAMDAGKVYVKISNKTDEFAWRYLETPIDKLKKVGQKDIILPYAEDDDGNEYIQLVLYEITEVKYNFKDIDFKLSKVYNIFDRDNPEIPENGFSTTGAKSDLVE